MSPKPAPYGYPANPQTLGQRIRKRRRDVALLQRELAQKLGTDVQTIRNWEADRTQPTHLHLPQIIAFLGYNPLPEAMTFGERLIRHRLVKGMTQAEMADRIGVNPSTLASWEDGSHQPLQRSLRLLHRQHLE